ncbi:hypothetical protein GC197_16480 [bacterium]|nr:hypothetical protein [bacterium]
MLAPALVCLSASRTQRSELPRPHSGPYSSEISCQRLRRSKVIETNSGRNASLPRSPACLLLVVLIIPTAGCFLPVLLPSPLFETVVDIAPEGTATASSLYTTYLRISKYWQAHSKLPEGYADLPTDDGKGESRNDEWDRPLLWKSDGMRFIEIYSLGKDGVEGGSDLNARRSILFDTQRSSELGMPEIKVE